ncbi:hypothetical protein K491DRAFT_758099 [Lophiostoma macrostomum CBS 122681]|uniref:KN homeodomain domain-containing protein n=1 Tax=Lophiostoma macrostomum CBS 122681 TaxID=1314788 RepID=A0A6A6T724_9PLEO|nr:hypothetical protein K491DRAFT_758099 [Lophiostoma macrostomum CBS 122681]
MECLRVRELPHRGYASLSARRMASPDERPRTLDKAGGLPSLAAVCEAQSLLPHLETPAAPSSCPALSEPDSLSSFSSGNEFSPTSAIFSLPEPPRPPDPTKLSVITHVEQGPTTSAGSPSPSTTDTTLVCHRLPPSQRPVLPSIARLDSLSMAGVKRNRSDSSEQSHHIRHSPPFQPGEQRQGQNALPSFSQLLQTVREPSPPNTPSRTNTSMESSPVHAPHFDDVAWSDGKRRRIDTTADIYRSERAVYDIHSRRTSNIDPALSATYGSPRAPLPAGMPPPTQSHYHRPSLPHPAPPQHPAVHARHQSSPIPHGHAYQSQPVPPMTHHTAYPSAPVHPNMHYEHRPSYYPDGHAHPPPHGNPYDRPGHDPYFAQRAACFQGPHPGYSQEAYTQQPQYAYQFQSHGVDHNAFNRKRRGNLPKEATSLLKNWFNSHRDSPYPTEDEKVQLCTATNLTLNQVSCFSTCPVLVTCPATAVPSTASCRLSCVMNASPSPRVKFNLVNKHRFPIGSSMLEGGLHKRREKDLRSLRECSRCPFDAKTGPSHGCPD